MAESYHFDESLEGPARKIKQAPGGRMLVIPRKAKDYLGPDQNNAAYRIKKKAIELIAMRELEGENGTPIGVLIKELLPECEGLKLHDDGYEYIWRQIQILVKNEVILMRKEPLTSGRLTNIYYMDI